MPCSTRNRRANCANDVVVARAEEFAFVVIMLNRHVGGLECLVAVGRLILVGAIAPIAGNIVDHPRPLGGRVEWCAWGLVPRVDNILE